MGLKDRVAVRWLKSQLPELVASGVLTAENAAALEQHYVGDDDASHGLAFVLLAIFGSALIAAGVILLIAHNWDELSRPVRSIIAFVPLLGAQGLSLFVLLRRDDSQPWRESAAILDVAAVGTAIALISQTYQVPGTLSEFILIWMLLAIPVVYLLRSTAGATAYICGTIIWLAAAEKDFYPNGQSLWFWPLLLMVAPYYARSLRRARFGRETESLSILLLVASGVGIGFTSELARSHLASLAFAGLFSGAYVVGARFFSRENAERESPLVVRGAAGVGIISLVLSFSFFWEFRLPGPPALSPAPYTIALAIQLFFPVAALALTATSLIRESNARFNPLAAALPLIVAIAWLLVHFSSARTINGAWSTSTREHASWGAYLFDFYALALGAVTLMRGLRAKRIAKANVGLLLIALLATVRFVDSDLSFVTRSVGFIVVGSQFLVANMLLFKKRRAR